MGLRLNGHIVASPPLDSDDRIRATGFEPATLWTQTTRSTKLSYALLVRS